MKNWVAEGIASDVNDFTTQGNIFYAPSLLRAGGSSRLGGSSGLLGGSGSLAAPRLAGLTSILLPRNMAPFSFSIAELALADFSYCTKQ